MTESKKAWVTPELIVLVRSNPEEAVLSACKIAHGDSGALACNETCNTWVTYCNAWCAGTAGS